MSKHKLAAGLAGLLAGLLAARLIALLFAARPDNPALGLLLALTAPLVAPFGILDRVARQPQFGARLDLATLAALVLLIGVAAAVQWMRLARSRDDAEEHHAQS